LLRYPAQEAADVIPQACCWEEFLWVALDVDSWSAKERKRKRKALVNLKARTRVFIAIPAYRAGLVK